MGDIKTRFTLEGEQQYRNAMTQAANAVKVLNAQEKLAKAQFEQTGNAEKYAAAQADILRQKITQQKAAVAAAEKALKQLSDNGVSENSKQFQQWQTKLLTAQTALAKMETQLGQVTTSMDATTSAADKTNDAISAIGQKVSFDGVIGGINKITDAMKSAAGFAKDLAFDLGAQMLSAASWADDLATDALVFGLTQDELQRMQAAAWKFDTTVDAIVKSKDKLKNNMVKGSDDVKGYFDALGVAIETFTDTGFGIASTGFRNIDDVYWDIGNALMNYGDAIERDVMAQAIFGKSWRELLPLFTAGRKEYEAFLDSQDTVSDDSIKNLTNWDDSWQQFKTDWNIFKMTVFSDIAPSFEKLAETGSGLLKQFNAYLDTDEGKEKMQALGDAVSSLFEGITEADFGAAMDTAKGAIEGLTGGLEWIKDNWSAVEGGLKALGTAFLGLEVTDSVLTFMRLLSSGGALLSSIFHINPSSPTSTPSVASQSGGGGFGGLLGKVLNFGGSLVSGMTNASFVSDWFFNQTTLGRWLGGKHGVSMFDVIGEAGKWVSDTISNFQTFGEDWDGVFREFLGGIDSGADQDYLDFEEELAARIRADLGLDEPPEGNGISIFDEYMQERLEKELENTGKGLPDLGKEFAGIIGTPEITVEPKPDANAAEKISQDVGVVTIAAELIPFGGRWINPSFTGGAGGGGGGRFGDIEFHANGLSYVPFDGYPAILHKGERVLTAREANHYNTNNSNLYVESMIMNNGQDADALAARMAAAQQRIMRGYGS